MIKQQTLITEYKAALLKRNGLEARARTAEDRIRHLPYYLTARQMNVRLAEAELREIQELILTGSKLGPEDDPKQALLARNRAELKLEAGRAKVRRCKELARKRTDPLKKADQAVREIEHEILTGQSVHPLFNQGRAAEPEPPSLDQVRDEMHREMKTAASAVVKSYFAEEEERWAKRNQSLANEKPKLASAKQAAQEDGTWVYGRDDVDAELVAALWSGDRDWTLYQQRFATDEQIKQMLCEIWPTDPVYRDAKTAGTKHGHTLACKAGVPRIWVRVRKALNAKPDLAGQELIDRVRELLAIPRPTLVNTLKDEPKSKPAQVGRAEAKSSFKDMTSVTCKECGTVRPRGAGACAKCGNPSYRLTVSVPPVPVTQADREPVRKRDRKAVANA